MAETAKIVSPHKKVLHPSPDAGCSLSDGITAEDIVNLKERHPEFLLFATSILVLQLKRNVMSA